MALKTSQNGIENHSPSQSTNAPGAFHMTSHLATARSVPIGFASIHSNQKMIIVPLTIAANFERYLSVPEHHRRALGVPVVSRICLRGHILDSLILSSLENDGLIEGSH